MKKILTIITSVVLSIMSYADIAYDSSDDPVYGGTWTPLQSQNGGNGFNAWMFGGNWWTGKSGVYMNTDTPGSRGFRSWSNSDGNVTALRTFENPLNSGETFSMNLGHWGGNNGELKIRLGSNSLPVFNISLISGNSYWQAYDGNTFDLNDSNGSANYFTTDDQNAQFTFTYHGGNSYGMSLVDNAGNGYSFDTKIATSVSASEMESINSFMITNSGQGSGSNFYIDNMQIIPEPATIGLLGIFGSLGLFIRKRFEG